MIEDYYNLKKKEDVLTNTALFEMSTPN